MKITRLQIRRILKEELAGGLYSRDIDFINGQWDYIKQRLENPDELEGSLLTLIKGVKIAFENIENSILRDIADRDITAEEYDEMDSSTDITFDVYEDEPVDLAHTRDSRRRRRRRR